MGEALIIRDLTLVLLAAILGGVVAGRLRLPTIIGYMMAGGGCQSLHAWTDGRSAEYSVTGRNRCGTPHVWRRGGIFN